MASPGAPRAFWWDPPASRHPAAPHLVGYLPALLKSLQFFPGTCQAVFWLLPLACALLLAWNVLPLLSSSPPTRMAMMPSGRGQGSCSLLPEVWKAPRPGRSGLWALNTYLLNVGMNEHTHEWRSSSLLGSTQNLLKQMLQQRKSVILGTLGDPRGPQRLPRMEWAGSLPGTFFRKTCREITPERRRKGPTLGNVKWKVVPIP